MFGTGRGSGLASPTLLGLTLGGGRGGWSGGLRGLLPLMPLMLVLKLELVAAGRRCPSCCLGAWIPGRLIVGQRVGQWVSCGGLPRQRLAVDVGRGRSDTCLA